MKSATTLRPPAFTTDLTTPSWILDTNTGIIWPMNYQHPEFMHVLGLSPPYVIEDVEQAFRQKALIFHPDRGGNPEDFRDLYDAYVKAQHYVRFSISRREWLGDLVEQYALQEQLIREIESAGGRVVLEKSDWMETWLGRDFAQVTDRLIHVDLTGVSDADDLLERILGAEAVRDGLRILNLSGTHIPARNLQRLDQLNHLEVLALNFAQLSIDDIQMLESTINRMPALHRLELAGNQIPLIVRFGLRWRHRNLLFIFSKKSTAAHMQSRGQHQPVTTTREYRSADRIEYLSKEMYKYFIRGQQSKAIRRPWWQLWK